MAKGGTTAHQNLTAKQVDRLKAPIELDLIAFYNVVADDIERTVDRMTKAGATADEVIDEIERMLDDEGDEGAEEGPDQ